MTAKDLIKYRIVDRIQAHSGDKSFIQGVHTGNAFFKKAKQHPYIAIWNGEYFEGFNYYLVTYVSYGNSAFIKPL